MIKLLVQLKELPRATIAKNSLLSIMEFIMLYAI